MQGVGGTLGGGPELVRERLDFKIQLMNRSMRAERRPAELPETAQFLFQSIPLFF